MNTPLSLRIFSLAIIVISAHTLSPPVKNLRSLGSPADYDIYEFNVDVESSGLSWFPKTGSFSSTGRNYSAFIAIFEPVYFAFLPPTVEGCTDYIKTSISSSETWSCDYATNGGFFTWDETVDIKCVGNLLSDGNIIIQDGMSNANFGVTSDGKVLTGFVDEAVFSDMKLSQLISGYGWLVRNGASYVSQSSDLNVTSNFVVEKAPRTAVGVFGNGSMVLVEVDGEEDIDYGPDLFEFAELLVDLGVQSAVNIDGGGSSVSVSDGKVVSQPTCDDTSTICEREVQSIACVRKQKSIV